MQDESLRLVITYYHQIFGRISILLIANNRLDQDHICSAICASTFRGNSSDENASLRNEDPFSCGAMATVHVCVNISRIYHSWFLKAMVVLLYSSEVRYTPCVRPLLKMFDFIH